MAAGASIPFRYRRQGFSLIELLVVLALIGIVAAIAAPRFAAASATYRVEMAARRVAADMKFAQRYARMTSQQVILSFDASGHRYRLGGVPDPSRAAQEYAVDLSVEPFAVRLTGVNLAPGDQVVFDAYGAPSAGGSVTLGSGDRTRVVTLDPNTGGTGIQ
jgi:type II secretion system protein H